MRLSGIKSWLLGRPASKIVVMVSLRYPGTVILKVTHLAQKSAPGTALHYERDSLFHSGHWVSLTAALWTAAGVFPAMWQEGAAVTFGISSVPIPAAKQATLRFYVAFPRILCHVLTFGHYLILSTNFQLIIHQTRNYKFCEEPLTYSPKQLFYCFVCIRCQIRCHRCLAMMEGYIHWEIYEVCHWDGIKCRGIHIKFHENWFTHSNANKDRHTDGMVIT
jgi:hypothetical protein